MTRLERMRLAVELVEQGYTPRLAAESAEVNLQALYRRLRRSKPRCVTCGRTIGRSINDNAESEPS